MPMYQKVSGAWRPISGLNLEVAGTWRVVTKAWIKVAGVWRQFFGALSASLDTTVANGAGAAGFLSTSSVVASGVQGAPGYIYAWEYVSGDIGPAASTPSSASTNWSAISGPSTVLVATWRCKVTDMAGVSAYSADVTVTLTYT